MSQTALVALESKDFNASLAIVHVSSHDVGDLAILLFTLSSGHIVCLVGRCVRPKLLDRLEKARPQLFDKLERTHPKVLDRLERVPKVLSLSNPSILAPWSILILKHIE